MIPNNTTKPNDNGNNTLCEASSPPSMNTRRRSSSSSSSSGSKITSCSIRIRSNNDHRNRLIQSLGINQNHNNRILLFKNTTTIPIACTITTKTSNRYHQQQKHLLKGTIQEIPLKNHAPSLSKRRNNQKIEEDMYHHQQQQQLTTRRNRRRSKSTTTKCIQFNTTVQSMPIPSHTEYSTRMRQTMYGPNRYERHENVQRNVREYAFEGWNVHHVLEEDQMYLDTGSMTFIHPVHVVEEGGGGSGGRGRGYGYGYS